MKGKINVTCVIGRDYNTQEDVVTATKIKIENKDSKVSFGKGLDGITVKTKYPVSLDTLHIIAEEKGILAHLEDKGGLVLKDCPAEFVYAKAKNEDRWYHAVIVQVGTPNYPVKRTFYLNEKKAYYLSKITTEYEFTKVETLLDDSSESEDNE